MGKEGEGTKEEGKRGGRRKEGGLNQEEEVEVDETGSEDGPKGAPAEKHGRAGTKRCRGAIKSRAQGGEF